MNRKLFGGSRTNRDRRDQAYHTATSDPPALPNPQWIRDSTTEIAQSLEALAKRYPTKLEVKNGKLQIRKDKSR